MSSSEGKILCFPKTIRCLGSPEGICFEKIERSIVYVKLYGKKISRSDRHMVMNALDNQFHCWGKISDVGRLPEKYSHFGDFFITFEDVRAAEECSKFYSSHRFHKLDQTLRLPPFLMEVW